MIKAAVTCTHPLVISEQNSGDSTLVLGKEYIDLVENIK